MDGRRVRGEATWAAAREAYLAGAAAADVCERHGFGLSALRGRARREGWRRSDQADADLDTLDGGSQAGDPDGGVSDGDRPDGEILDGEAPDAAGLAGQAWRRAAVAVERGRLREAQGWTRLWRELNAAAVDAADARERARTAQVSAERRAATDDACAVFTAACNPLEAARAAVALLEYSSVWCRKEGNPLEAARAAVARGERVAPEAPIGAPTEAGRLHSVHLVHPVSSALAPEPDAVPPRPLNRAERRRRERLEATKGRRCAVPAAWSGGMRPRDGPAAP